MANFNFDAASIVADNIVVVKGTGDLPDPVMVGGILSYVLEDKQYLIDGDISVANPIAFPGTGKTCTLTAVNRSTWTYTGTDACFKDPAADGSIEIIGLTEFKAPSGDMWDVLVTSGVGSLQAAGPACRFTDCNSLGTFDGGASGNGALNLFFGTLSNFDQGLTISNCFFSELNTMFFFGNNVASCVYITVDGVNTSGSSNLINNTFNNGTNETAIDYKAEIETPIDSVNYIGNFLEGGTNGIVFATDSLDQATPKVVASGNTFIPNSTVKAKLDVAGNALTTTIAAADTPVAINAIWTDGAIEERLLFADFCTFDNTTDFITTQNDVTAGTLTHGLSNGDIINFLEDGGLPTGITADTDYFIIGATATTFQVSLTSGGAAVDFTTNGTTPNYYLHDTGNSASGWVIYSGIQDISIVVNGWAAIDKAGANANCGVQLIKTDTSFVETNAAKGSTVNVQNGRGQSSVISDIVSLKKNEGVKLHVENRENADDVSVEDAEMTYNLA